MSCSRRTRCHEILFNAFWHPKMTEVPVFTLTKLLSPRLSTSQIPSPSFRSPLGCLPTQGKVSGHGRGLISKSPQKNIASFCRVDKLVAMHAEGDEILLGVVSQLAAWTDMVHVKISNVPAELAAPSVAFEDPLPESSITLWVESLARVLREWNRHDVPSACAKNSCLWVRGNNP